MITLCLTFWETAKILCKATRLSCIPSSLPASYAWVFQFLYMCGNVFYAPSVFLPQPLLLVWEVSLWLWHTSPWWLISNNEHCFKCYLFFISFGESIYPSPLPIFKWFTCLLNSELEEFIILLLLYRLSCVPFYCHMLQSYFSPYSKCSLPWWHGTSFTS